jgi:hypothetical protein
MGYTNYWHQHNDFTDSEWKQIKQEYDYITEVCVDIIVDVTITTDEIVFNGKGENAHETFHLSKNAKPFNFKKDYEGQDTSFYFCKTAMKPYDIAVWNMLTFINRICPSFSISRDYP